MCLPVKPFKVEREWSHAGLLCAVVQAREGGHRCAYVRVPPSHPAHGKDYNEVDVDVHGGLTFGAIEPCAHEDGTGFWFGFDFAHSGDASYEKEFNESWSEETKQVWKIIMGTRAKFPISSEEWEHFWTQAEVEREAERLAEQLVAVANGDSKSEGT